MIEIRERGVEVRLIYPLARRLRELHFVLDLVMRKQPDDSDSFGTCEVQSTTLKSATGDKSALCVVFANLLKLRVKLLKVVNRDRAGIILAFKHPNQRRANPSRKEDLD